MRYRVIALSVALAACGRLRFDPIDDGSIDGPPGDAFTGMKVTYVKASNTGQTDQFGSCVALSADGNTLAVGALYEDGGATGVNGTPDDTATDSGAAYVFVRSGDTWVQQAYIKPSNTDSQDLFGCAIALSADGNTLAVGAYLEDSSSIGINGAQDNSALGDNSGAAYVFVRVGDAWSQQAYIKASNTDQSDNFARALALSADGNTLAVGCYLEGSSATGIGGDQTNNNATKSGAVYIYTRSGTTWAQQEYIKASNTGMDDQFGWSVSLSQDGNTLAVGAVLEDSNGTSEADNSATDAGAAYLYVRSGSSWLERAYVKGGGLAGDYFGQSVTLSADGSTLSVGAIYADAGPTAVNCGEANVYYSTGGRDNLRLWSFDAGDTAGRGIGLSGNGTLLVVGADNESSNATGLDGDATSNAAPAAGAAYVLTKAASWSLTHYVKATNTDAGDRFGVSIALTPDARVLAIGAIGEASAATGVNGDQSDNSAAAAGAVYLIE